MAQPSTKTNKTTPVHNQEHEPKLKGTFAAVMILGGFLLITWLGVFALFLARN